jgi:hypothetical protein
MSLFQRAHDIVSAKARTAVPPPISGRFRTGTAHLLPKFQRLRR